MSETAVGDMNVCVGNAIDLFQKEGSERNIVLTGSDKMRAIQFCLRVKTKSIAELATTKLTI